MAKKPFRFRAIHEKTRWRKASHETFQNATTSGKRSAKALFDHNNDVINYNEHGEPLYVVIWNVDDENSDGVIVRKNTSTGQLDFSSAVPRSLIDEWEVSKDPPDDSILEAYFANNSMEAAGVIWTQQKSKEYNQQTDESLSKDLLGLLSIDETERETQIKARVGQGKFKDNVKSLWGMERCFVTLIDIPSMLIASHIKPWAECNDNPPERIDGANGLLLCAHIDKLFDLHLITFKGRGRNFELVMSEKLLDQKEVLKSLGVEVGLELPIDKLWNNISALERFKAYMSLHNENFDKLNSN